MCIGLLKLKIGIEWAFSLKDKRQAVKSTKEKIRAKFNVSTAEVDNHDIYNRSTIAIVMVNKDKIYIEKSFHNIVNFIEKLKDITLENVEIELF